MLNEEAMIKKPAPKKLASSMDEEMKNEEVKKPAAKPKVTEKPSAKPASGAKKGADTGKGGDAAEDEGAGLSKEEAE